MDDVDLQEAIKSAWPQLVDFLSLTPEWVMEKAKRLLPQMDLNRVEGVANPKEKVSLVLDMFLSTVDAPILKEFMQSVCMECNLPMDLEIVFMCASGGGLVTQGQEVFTEAAAQLPSTSRPERRRPWISPPTNNNCKQSKQQRLDAAERYRQLIITSMLQRYEINKQAEATQAEVQPTAFSQAFVNLVIRQSKACRIKGKVDKAKEELIALHDGEEHSDATMRLSDLFESVHTDATKVVLLLGKPGMGKTRLMHKICQQWAEGNLQQFQLIFFFEFRQLNLISRRLTLRELCFDFFHRPEDCPDAVFEHLLENAQHMLLIFDGLDEFVGNIQPLVSSNVFPNCLSPLSISELFASLCHGKLLCGCTVLVTTRPKMLPAPLLKTITLLAEIWGFDREKVEEYAGYFFHQHSLKQRAIAHLKSNSELLSLCYIPALCNIVCICLEYLLLQDAGSVQLPQTMTQFYIKMLLIFIGKQQSSSGVSEEVYLHRQQATIVGLCELAFKGLEERKMLFYADEVPQHVKDFACLYGLLLAFEVKTSSGHSQAGYTFVHFSLQEFLAALFMLTSKTVDHNCLKQNFFLRSKWMLKKEAKMAFTENCHVFLSGLSSQGYRQYLSSLAGQNETWIQQRQAMVTEMLGRLASASLTGPRIIELSHCVHEAQNLELARHVGKQLNFTFQFRNFRLMPLDVMTLTFVISSSHDLVCLDFVGCPIELDYLDVLASCENIKSLSFRSRKCGNEFAAVLSKNLPKIKCLTAFQLAGGNLTIPGLKDLIQAFPNCHQLEDISLQDNKMKGREMNKIMEIFSTVKKLKKLDLSHNEISATTVLDFARAAAVYPNITKLLIRKNILIINFTGQFEQDPSFQPSGIKKEEAVPQTRILSLRLQDCHLNFHQAEKLADILRRCPHLSEMDFSGNQLRDEGCRELVKVLPEMCISGQLNLSNNRLSLKSTFCLLNSMSLCPNIVKLEASLNSQTAILTLVGNEVGDGLHPRSRAFNDEQFSSDQKQTPKTSRKICLIGNKFHGEDLRNMCLELRRCSWVSELDLSDNSLGDQGVLKVAELLPDLKMLCSLKLNHNHITLNGVFGLGKFFSALEQMTSMHLGLGSTQSVHLIFGERISRSLASEDQGKLLDHLHPSKHGRYFCLEDCMMGAGDVDQLFKILTLSSGLAEINLSRSLLDDQGVERLLKFLPHLDSLKLLGIRSSTFSAHCVCLLANSFNLCKRICDVEVRSSKNASLHFVESHESQEISCRLTDCGIGQGDIQDLCIALEKCDRLAELDLSGNHLGNEGLKCLLEHLPRIRASCLMKIDHNGISQEGILHLVNALARCHNVAEVHARLAECGFRAEHLLQLSAGLGTCLALSTFISTNNGMALRDAEDLCRALRRPTGMLRISIEEPWVKDQSISALQKLAAEVQGNLTKITIRRDGALFGVEQEFPCQAESVVSRLHHCELEEFHFLPKLIEKCSQLQALSWSQVQLMDAEAATLADTLQYSPALKRLELLSCRILPTGTKTLAKGLRQCHLIENIDFSKSELGTDGVDTLVSALEGKLHLKSINLSSLDLDNAGVLLLTSRLPTMPLLGRLLLNNNSLGSEACCHLTKALKDAIHMEEIDLSHNKIDDAGVKEIAAAVPGLQNMKQINLSGNNISSAGGQCFVEALADCKHLEELRLSANSIGNETLEKLAQVLPCMHQLKVLHLSSCGIDSEGVAHLATALCRCPQMEEISLSENSVGSEGIEALAEWLPQSPQLRTIELKCCRIDDRASRPLALGVSRCHFLEEIVLSWNSLGDQSALELAKVLPGMKRLSVMDLDNNRITECGARSLAEVLPQCRGIRCVRLWRNRIPKDIEENLRKQEPRMHFSFF
ncbi:protein NLRC5 isoform X2 [Hemicordylus capensis]|uniref:protein NLRC5 isoform X2 n=1 Tax=Hemicordylus capensis TaxID=884348 RepID=UPI0023045052|nr:protein NLRC5 isoform X2 [Hemicordylus capensis]